MKYKNLGDLEKTLKESFVNKTVSLLAEKGEDIIKSAYTSRSFKNDTFNLKDSYGYAVYFDRRLKEYGTLGMMEASKKKPSEDGSNNMTFGREDFLDYIKGYGAKPNIFELIVVVAKFYGKDLELGRGVAHPYRVIFQTWDDMEDLNNKIGGVLKKIEDD